MNGRGRRTRVLALGMAFVGLGPLAPGATMPAQAQPVLPRCTVQTPDCDPSAPQVRPQQISEDPYTNPDAQHRTEVEPGAFAWGKVIVSAFQVGRSRTVGATNIGWATSLDGGRTWSHGFLPGLTVHSSPPGPVPVGTDPTVTYDAIHGQWLIAVMTCTTVPCGTNTGIVVSRSSDGLTWGQPVVAYQGQMDKEWIVCDNDRASSFAGRCYIAWRGTQVIWSDDGGASWTSPVFAGYGMQGVQPLVRPGGSLVIVGWNVADGRYAAVTSSNGGATFGPPVTVAASLQAHDPTAMRAKPIPSATLDASGKIYVAWHDCRFRAACSANDILLTTSTDGTTWTSPAVVPTARAGSTADHFIPAIGADPRPGFTGRIAMTYYTFTATPCDFESCRLNIEFISSPDGGASWERPRVLNGQPMSISWLADTSQGRMVGDYTATVFSEGLAVPVFTIANRPRAGAEFDEAIYSTRLALAPPTPFAVVAAGGAVVRGGGVLRSERTGAGTYDVVFDRDISGCAYTATIGDTANQLVYYPGYVFTARGTSGTGAVSVRVTGLEGAASDRPFHLDVSCSGGPSRFAVVAANGTMARGSAPATSARLSPGRYEVTFDRDVSACAYTATIGDTGSGVTDPTLVYTAGGHSGVAAVYVETKNIGGGLTDEPFHLAVHCAPTDVYAVVADDGQLVRGSHATGVTRLGTGRYEVNFDRDVGGCAFTATIGDTANALVYHPGLVFTAGGHGSVGGVYVETKNLGGGLADWPFHLDVTC